MLNRIKGSLSALFSLRLFVLRADGLPMKFCNYMLVLLSCQGETLGAYSLSLDNFPLAIVSWLWKMNADKQTLAYNLQMCTTSAQQL